jgi:nitroreductase
MDFGEVVKNRHSIRAFKEKKVENEKIERILETANKAPSAGNLQAYEIVVVENQQARKDLARAALGQDFIVEAPAVLVFFANPKRSAWKYGERGEKLYSIQDATIAAAHAQLAAVNEGLGCAWVGAFDEEEIKNVLEAPDNLKPVAIVPIGYPAEKPKVHKKRALDDIVHREPF